MTVLLSMAATVVGAQTKVTGLVVEYATDEPLVGVTVTLQSNGAIFLVKKLQK